MRNKTVQMMVLEYLEKKGYDGLYNDDDECGCLCDDLAPCGEMKEHCSAGYKHDYGVGWGVYAQKQ